MTLSAPTACRSLSS